MIFPSPVSHCHSISVFISVYFCLSNSIFLPFLSPRSQLSVCLSVCASVSVSQIPCFSLFLLSCPKLSVCLSVRLIVSVSQVQSFFFFFCSSKNRLSVCQFVFLFPSLKFHLSPSSFVPPKSVYLCGRLCFRFCVSNSVSFSSVSPTPTQNTVPGSGEAGRGTSRAQEAPHVHHVYLEYLLGPYLGDLTYGVLTCLPLCVSTLFPLLSLVRLPLLPPVALASLVFICC